MMNAEINVGDMVDEECKPNVVEDVEENSVEVKAEKKKPVSSWRKKKGGKGKKKKKSGIPDPYSSTSEQICRAIGLRDVELDYKGEEFQGITNLKNFSNTIKPLILAINPGAHVHKMYPLFQVKYKEFQDYMNAHGNPIEKRRASRVFVPPPLSVVPTTRSLSRKRVHRFGHDSDEGQDSDQEFEAMIEQYDESKPAKEDQRVIKEVARPRTTSRATRRSRQSRDGDFQQNFCQVCKEVGELIPCETCPRSYHFVCIEEDMDQPPEGDWSCPHCQKPGPEMVQEPPTHVTEICHLCKSGENLLVCSNCPHFFHAYCLFPALNEIPQMDWRCPLCRVKEKIVSIEKIVTWRWKEIKYPEPLDVEEEDPDNEEMAYLKPPHDMGTKREREFLLKLKHMSYWRCEWIPEYAMNTLFSTLVRCYWRKVDQETPPISEDSVLGRHHADDDHYRLRERFVQYGIKAEWLMVDRVLQHKTYADNDQEYLVKWKELPYDKATWERGDTDIPNYKEAVLEYWLHQERMSETGIPQSIQRMINKLRGKGSIKPLELLVERAEKEQPPQKKVDICTKYTSQPDFITETGGTLHPYQMEGINWLRHCWSTGTDAILADEMGLGKTVQSLSFLYTLMKEKHCTGPFLVVAPLSTIINWEREAEQWCPDFYVVSYIGDRDSRAVIRDFEISFIDDAVDSRSKLTKIRTQERLKFHVLLTSYEIINMDKTFLSSINWEVLVVDEAHRLKNNQSTFFKNLRDYSINYRVLLSGTPLQNNLEELFHLLNFLSPERFNKLEDFTGGFSEISKEDQIGKLHALLGPHMLRRLKTDVLTGMPPKCELIVRVELSAMQKTYYKNILTRNFDALNVKDSGTQMSLMNIIMELKKCCNHPYLFLKAATEARKSADGMFEGTELVEHSGKLLLLKKMLRKLKEQGHRVLIFSQMTMMLDLLEDFCVSEQYKCERIDGTITGQQRQVAIDRFNAPGAEQFIFLLSTRAGGLGINLATADTVIIYDSDWNPHNDIQAFSRAHRLGQKNKVMIYRFVTKGSVEERILSVAKKKMLLTHLVVRAGLGGKEGKSMSKSELDDVLRWGTEELFKEDEPGVAEGDEKKKANEQEIVWDDAAVDYLLDRDKADDAPEGEKEKHWANEYLSTFKVATYNTKVADQEDQQDIEIIKEEDNVEPDPAYWKKLLKHHYEQDQEVEAQQLGKGKRIRRQINYAAENMGADWNNQQFQNPDDSDVSTCGDSKSGELAPSDEDYDEKKRDRRDSSEKLPPLLAKVNGQLEVLGFNNRQRKAFYNAVMRWGMPPQDSYDTQWRVRDLRRKSEPTWRAYRAMFMRHLCETGLEDRRTFSDGVPIEGLDRMTVLSRIGIMHLVRRKVEEFARYNGEFSIPEKRDMMLAPSAKDHNQPSTSSASDSREPSAVSAEEEIEELMDTSDSKTPKVARPNFKFNIVDGGFTDLHLFWATSEKNSGNGSRYDIWNRRHDYWLLAGIMVYGYERSHIRYSEIINDPRFAILKEPFEMDVFGFRAITDEPSNYLSRRFKVLELSLVIEEQLRRSAHLRIQSFQGPDSGSTLAQKVADMENLAFSHAAISTESHNLNRNANAVYQNVLESLQEMLSVINKEVIKLPENLRDLPPVTERLHMTEKEILSRLANPEANPNPLPPSGPFITPMPDQYLAGIQPSFASLLEQHLTIFDDDLTEELEPGTSEIAAPEDEEIIIVDDDDDERDVPSTSTAHQ